MRRAAWTLVFTYMLSALVGLAFVSLESPLVLVLGLTGGLVIAAVLVAALVVASAADDPYEPCEPHHPQPALADWTVEELDEIWRRVA